MTTETMPKKYLDLIDTLNTANSLSFFVYRLPITRNRSGVKNTCITFYKNDEGCVHAIVAPSMAYLDGWLSAAGFCGHLKHMLPVTIEQYLSFGEPLPPDTTTRSPGVMPGVYAGG